MSRNDALIVAACCLLSGCVAAPLAQMALTQVRPAAAPCAPGLTCPPPEDAGTLAAVSHKLGNSIRRSTGAWDLY